MDDDLTFRFDPSFFQKGIDKVMQGMDGMRNMATGVASGMQKGFQAVAAKVGTIVVAIKGLKGILNQIPEIGQAFGIAKDIFTKNLLWPLRKSIFPLLQKMMDWVRDNRVMFVKWGQALANVFEIVFNLAGRAFNVAKEIGSGFINLVNKIFGTQVKSFEELVNVMTFKLAVALEFLSQVIKQLKPFIDPIVNLIGNILVGAIETVMSLISGFMSGIEGIGKPIQSILQTINDIVTALFSMNEEGNSIQTIFNTIGNIVGQIVKFITEMADSFLKGLAPGLKGLVTPIQNIFDAIKGIVEKLFTGEKPLQFWKDVFNVLGQVIGTVIKTAFEIIAGAIQLIEKGIGAMMRFFESEGFQSFINNIKGFVEGVGGFFAGIGEGAANIAGGVVKGVGDFFDNLFGGDKKTTKVDDAIIRPDGQIIKTNPNDTIIATQNGLPSKNISMNIDFSGMQLVLQGASQGQAEMFANDIVTQIRNQLSRELERVGR